MHRPATMSALCLAITFAAACARVTPERSSYAPDWPALPVDTSMRCAAPLGRFENASERWRFGKDSSFAAPTLAHVLGVSSQGARVTHIDIEELPGKKLRITAFDIADGAPREVGRKLLDLADSTCRNGRWTIVTTPTHTSWEGTGQENYDPLFMLTMPIATLGVGLLAMPMSDWWSFSFAVADDGSLALRRQKMESGMVMLLFYSKFSVEDDWFLYQSADLEQMIRTHDEPIPLAADEPALPEVPACLTPDVRSPAELYAAGMSFYRRTRYEPAVDCLRMAAEAPTGASREAMWQLCIVYELGQGVEPDLDTAKQWCARSSGE